LLWSESYPRGSRSIYQGLGDFLLVLYRRRADREIVGYAMQDAARHVSYGLGSSRYHLKSQPDERPALGKYLDDSERTMAALIGAPELLEPLTIICGSGL
jgi:hypothetical protein